MCTQCVQVICTDFVHLKECTFDIFDKPTGITKKELTNVEIQEQTASFDKPFFLIKQKKMHLFIILFNRQF